MYTNDFTGIDNNGTFALAAGIVRGTDEGKVVKVTANKTMALCAAEDKFYGVLETIDQDNAFGMVEERKYKTLPYTGTAPGRGPDVELVANATGGVKIPATAGTGLKYKVVEVNTTDLTVMLRLG